MLASLKMETRLVVSSALFLRQISTKLSPIACSGNKYVSNNIHNLSKVSMCHRNTNHTHQEQKLNKRTPTFSSPAPAFNSRLYGKHVTLSSLNQKLNPSSIDPSHDPPSTQQGQPGGDTSSNKPSLDQLLKVYNNLQTNLPKLFTHPMDYTIYTQDVVLINNLLNKTTRGLFKYVQQVSLLRIFGHFKFAYVRLELISMSQDQLEGRITVRWRVVGISGLRVMLKFWKFKLWKWQEIMNQQEVWYDAISHFDVGADGLVYRHVVDKLEENKERMEAQKPTNSRLVAKLALLALLPRHELGSAIACGSLLQSTTTTASDEEEDDEYNHIQKKASSYG